MSIKNKQFILSLPGGLSVYGAMLGDDKAAKDISTGRGYAAVFSRGVFYFAGTSGQDALAAADVLGVRGSFTLGAAEPSVFDAFSARYTPQWVTRCSEYVYSGAAPLPAVPDSADVRPFPADCAEDAAAGVAYDIDPDEILRAVGNFPSAAVYEDGKAVCWCLMHDDGSLGMLYTRPEYRHKGYAGYVVAAVSAKAAQLGYTPFAHVIEGNSASAALLPRCGFSLLRECFWAQFNR